MAVTSPCPRVGELVWGTDLSPPQPNQPCQPWGPNPAGLCGRLPAEDQPAISYLTAASSHVDPLAAVRIWAPGIIVSSESVFRNPQKAKDFLSSVQLPLQVISAPLGKAWGLQEVPALALGLRPDLGVEMGFQPGKGSPLSSELGVAQESSRQASGPSLSQSRLNI